jgi:hypothetical protein
MLVLHLSYLGLTAKKWTDAIIVAPIPLNTCYMSHDYTNSLVNCGTNDRPHGVRGVGLDEILVAR